MNYDVSPQRAALQSCSSGLHTHLSSREISELQSYKAIEPIASPSGREIYRFRRMFGVRGLSARFGQELAEMLASGSKRLLAAMILNEIRRRRESPSSDYESLELRRSLEGI